MQKSSNGSVFEIIIEKISEKSSAFFVFPSETAASLWARKICLYGGVRSLSPERFLAWDRFKEQAMFSKGKGRKPVSVLISSALLAFGTTFTSSR